MAKDRSFQSAGIQAYEKTDKQGVRRVDISLMLTDLIACCKVAGKTEFELHEQITMLWPQIHIYPTKPTNGKDYDG
jgi:hypothetical protein